MRDTPHDISCGTTNRPRIAPDDPASTSLSRLRGKDKRGTNKGHNSKKLLHDQNSFVKGHTDTGLIIESAWKLARVVSSFFASRPTFAIIFEPMITFLCVVLPWCRCRGHAILVAFLVMFRNFDLCV